MQALLYLAWALLLPSLSQGMFLGILCTSTIVSTGVVLKVVTGYVNFCLYLKWSRKSLKWGLQWWHIMEAPQSLWKQAQVLKLYGVLPNSCKNVIYISKANNGANAQMLALRGEVVIPSGMAGMHKQWAGASKPLVRQTIWTARAETGPTVDRTLTIVTSLGLLAMTGMTPRFLVFTGETLPLLLVPETGLVCWKSGYTARRGPRLSSSIRLSESKMTSSPTSREAKVISMGRVLPDSCWKTTSRPLRASLKSSARTLR